MTGSKSESVRSQLTITDFETRLENLEAELTELNVRKNFAEQQILYLRNKKGKYPKLYHDIKIAIYLSRVNENGNLTLEVCIENDSSRLTQPISFTFGILRRGDKDDTYKSVTGDLKGKSVSEMLQVRQKKFYNIVDEDTITIWTQIYVHDAHKTQGVLSNLKTNENTSMEAVNTNDLSRMMKESKLADVTIKCGEYTRRCHKLVLAYRSDVFKKMFCKGAGKNDFIEISGTEPVALGAFISCLYKPDEDLLRDNAYEIMKLAFRYSVKDLFVSCSNALQKHLTVDIAPQCLLLSYLHEEQNLFDKSLQIVCDNFPAVLKSKDWGEITRSHPELLNTIISKLVTQ